MQLLGDDATTTSGRATPGPLTHPLPDASVGGLAGLVQMLAGLDGHADLADLADELAFEVRDLLPLIDAARMLGLVGLRGARVNLSDVGARWASAGIQEAKTLFADVVGERAPLVRTMVRALGTVPRGRLRDDFFRDLLRRGYTAEDTEKQLDIAIDWARYGELVDYDADTGELLLTSGT